MACTRFNPPALALLLAGCIGSSADAGEAGEEPEPEMELAGGNSGSEGHSPGGDRIPCPCSAHGRMVRVTVLAREGDDVRLGVEELIGTAPDLPLLPGDEVESRFVGRLPCYFGTIDVTPGEQALAVFHPSEMVTRERWAGVRLTPWAEDLLFAQTDQADLFVPASGLSQLAELVEQKGDGFAECRASFGDAGDLPGTATDGTSDDYYCIEGGMERVCGEDPALLEDLARMESDAAMASDPGTPSCASICSAIDAACGTHNDLCVEECVLAEDGAGSCREQEQWASLLECCAAETFETGCDGSFDLCLLEEQCRDRVPSGAVEPCTGSQP